MIRLNKMWAAHLLVAGTFVTWAGDAGSILEIRMLTAIGSARQEERKPLEAVVLRPLVYEDGRVAIPAGARVHGEIRRARPVGLGLVREQARVEIAFTSWDAPQAGGALNARLLQVDNAREQVDRSGTIQGILAASNPLGLVRGIWFRPRVSLLFRGPIGLTGAVGTAWSRMALGPVGAAGLIGTRLLLTRMPDPEIYLPPGTEMRLVLSALPADQEWGRSGVDADPEPDLAEFLRAQPRNLYKPDGAAVGDLIHLVFRGSRELLEQAFAAAGWQPADPLTRKTFARAYHAFTAREGYATAPVSKLLYEGRAPDLVFQKSLNSIAKRHHIRLWRVAGPNGEELWLGAATHDVGVAFDQKRFSLTHRIDGELDREREKVLADLAFVEALGDRWRTDGAPVIASGSVTDGQVVVASLRRPNAAMPALESATVRHQNRLATRMIRRAVLESKHYLIRENAYYLGYRAGRNGHLWRRGASMLAWK